VPRNLKQNSCFHEKQQAHGTSRDRTAVVPPVAFQGDTLTQNDTVTVPGTWRRFLRAGDCGGQLLHILHPLSHQTKQILLRCTVCGQVIVVDNFFTGRKDNVVHHLSNPRFELIRHDVVEPILLEVDQIYHLACPASPVHYKHNPIKTIKTNVAGTMNMLGLAREWGRASCSRRRSEVYGDPLEHPQKEEYWGHVNPIGEWVSLCYCVSVTVLLCYCVTVSLCQCHCVTVSLCHCVIVSGGGLRKPPEHPQKEFWGAREPYW